MNFYPNILGQFVRITDCHKCFKDLNQMEEMNTSWPNQQIRNKSCESEWNKYKYSPQNGDFAEVISILNSPIFEEPVYIIRSYGMFYIPIYKSGFEKIEVIQSTKT